MSAMSSVLSSDIFMIFAPNVDLLVSLGVFVGLGNWASDDARALDGGVGPLRDKVSSGEGVWHRWGFGSDGPALSGILMVSVFSLGGTRDGGSSALVLAARACA